MTIRTPPSISSRWAAPKVAPATRAIKTTILMIDHSIIRALSVSIHVLGERLCRGDGLETALGILGPVCQLGAPLFGQCFDLGQRVFQTPLARGGLGARQNSVGIIPLARFKRARPKLR